MLLKLANTVLILINKGPSNVNFLICRHQQSISDEGTRRILSLVWSNILCDSNNSKNIKSNCKIQNICCTPQYNRLGSSFFKNSCHWFSYVGPFQGGFFLNQMMRIWRPWIGARGRTKFVVHAIWKKKKKKKISTRCPENANFEMTLIGVGPLFVPANGQSALQRFDKIFGSKITGSQDFRSCSVQCTAVQCNQYQASWASPCWLLCLVWRKKEKQPI